MPEPNVKLRQARKRRFLSLHHAADLVGVSYQAYIRWEHGTQVPHLSTLELLCKAFDMTAEELGYGELIGIIPGDALKYASCFLSYSSLDQPFVERLYTDLQNAGVRCWYAPVDLKAGDHIRRSINEAVSMYDKFLVVLSENSAHNPSVEYEVSIAMKKNQIAEQAFCPVRLDAAIWQLNIDWLSYILEKYHIGDFTRWMEHTSYNKAFNQLLRSLLLEK